MVAKRGQIQLAVDDQRSHAGPAVGARNCHTVNIGFLDSGKRTDRLGDFGSGDVLTLPAESVADAIDEIEKAARRLCASDRRFETRRLPA